MMASVGAAAGTVLSTPCRHNLQNLSLSPIHSKEKTVPKSLNKSLRKKSLQTVLFDHCAEYLSQGPYLETGVFLAWWTKKKLGADFSRLRGKDQNTLLHISIWHKCSEDIITTLMDSWPEAARETDDDGDTPLHFSIVFKASHAIVQKVFSAWPAAAMERDNEGDTPLHLALIYESPFPVVNAILTACPEAARVKDAEGNTPLHRALAKGTPDLIVHAILTAWTDGAKEVNDLGKSTIEVAVSNNASDEVVHALTSAATTSPEYQKAFKHLCQRMFFAGNVSPPPSPSASAAAERAWTTVDSGTAAAAAATASKMMTAAMYSAWIDANSECATQRDQSGSTLLHHALEFSAPEDTVQATLHAWPNAAQVVDERGNSPLHIAFLKEHPESVVLAVLGASPETILATNLKGETPVDVALISRHSRSTWNAVVATLAATTKCTGFELLRNILQNKVGTAETKEPAMHSILALWPDTLTEMTPIERNWKGDVTKGGETLLSIALQNGATGPVLRTLLTPVSGCVSDIAPLNGASPETVVSLFEGLHMAQFSATAFNLSSPRHAHKTLDILASLHRILPAKSVRWAFASCKAPVFETNTMNGGHVERVASANVCRFEQMVVNSKSQTYVVDTLPPAKTLACVRRILDVCFQSELSVASTETPLGADYSPHMEMYIYPIIQLIREELAVFKTKVAVNPTLFRKSLMTMAMADSAVYDRAFLQTLELQENGKVTAYEQMLRKCADMQKCCLAEHSEGGQQQPGDLKQPTPHLIPLVLIVRRNIPTFKRIARLAFAQASESMSGIQLQIQFADETKAPYRLIEKSFTKGPDEQYPDCSKVFDVFGCIIDCTDYKSMCALFQAFVDRHNRGLLQMVRVKDRWTTPGINGWRDLRLNLMIEGVLFEVQIVIHAMLSIRTRSEMCQAYNEFRSIVEVFEMLTLPTGLDRHDFPFAVEAEEAVAAVVSSVAGRAAIAVVSPVPVAPAVQPMHLHYTEDEAAEDDKAFYAEDEAAEDDKAFCAEDEAGEEDKAAYTGEEAAEEDRAATEDDVPEEAAGDDAIAAVAVVAPLSSTAVKAVDAVEELAAWCTDMVAPILRPPQSPSIFNLPGTDSISESLAEFKVMEEMMAAEIVADWGHATREGAAEESENTLNESTATVFENEVEEDGDDEATYVSPDGLSPMATPVTSPNARKAARAAVRMAAEEVVLKKAAKTAGESENTHHESTATVFDNEVEDDGDDEATYVSPDGISPMTTPATSPDARKTARAAARMAVEEEVLKKAQAAAKVQNNEMVDLLTELPSDADMIHASPRATTADKLDTSPRATTADPTFLSPRTFRNSTPSRVSAGAPGSFERLKAVKMTPSPKAQERVSVRLALDCEATGKPPRKAEDQEHRVLAPEAPTLERAPTAETPDRTPIAMAQINNHGDEANEKEHTAKPNMVLATASEWESPPRFTESREEELVMVIHQMGEESSKLKVELAASNARIHNLEQVVALLCEHQGLNE